MKTFLSKNFLLEGPTAEHLYHEHAAGMPIIDYHCHLPVEEIAADRQFRTMTELWLDGDHYKWRAMRANGVDERYCTGSASDWEKFERWAATVPYTMMNPLYHWTHMELRRPFGIELLLHPGTARSIYNTCNECLQDPAFSARGLLRQWQVKVVCTTDDPADTLAAHKQLEEEAFEVRVLPGFRADKASAIEDPVAYGAYLHRLGEAADVDIRDPQSLLMALQRRHDYFASRGCRISDHGEERLFVEDYSLADIQKIFVSVLAGKVPSLQDVAVFKSWLLYELALMDHAKGWTQQFHLSALRDTNTRMLRQLGSNTGFDSIGDGAMARYLARFLDRLDKTNQLAPTILYSVNPAHNEVLATMAGNFSTGFPGKIQFGTAWWFMDQIDGMVRQMTALANMGLLSRFVGMLTDSRSFLSFSRHEYFRRILCNMVGCRVDRGELPHEISWLGKMIEDISYRNARDYFGF